MTAATQQPTILVVGNDNMLSYLLKRYAEQSGLAMASCNTLPSFDDFSSQLPAAIIFSSIEQLGEAQGMLGAASWHEIPILVCTSLAEEVQARELGADACLLHPLTYESFLAAMDLSG